jgi:putative sterol carrier protein
MSSISEVMTNLPNIFEPKKAKGWNRVIEFKLTGEEPGDFTVVIENQNIKVMEGSAPEGTKVNMTVFAESQYIVQMFTGEVPPMTLVNGKKISMKGSIVDSMSFSRIWNIPKKE